MEIVEAKSKRQELIERASDIFGCEPEQLTDPEGCGEADCIGCKIRHGFTELLDKNPVAAENLLNSVEAGYRKLTTQLESLNARKTALYQEKGDWDAEVEKVDTATLNNLNRLLADRLN